MWGVEGGTAATSLQIPERACPFTRSNYVIYIGQIIKKKKKKIYKDMTASFVFTELLKGNQNPRDKKLNMPQEYVLQVINNQSFSTFH